MLPYSFALITPAIILQLGAEPVTDILSLVKNGSIAAVMFVIWYLTLKYMLKQHEKTIKRYDDLVLETKNDYKELIKEVKDDHKQEVNRFIDSVEKQTDSNTYIFGVLQRLDVKLDQLLKK